MLVNGFFILHAHVARAGRVVHRPAALLVEDDGHARLGTATHHARQALQHATQFGHFAPDPGIEMANVVDNRSVEFLHRAAAFPPLEVLH